MQVCISACIGSSQAGHLNRGSQSIQEGWDSGATGTWAAWQLAGAAGVLFPSADAGCEPAAAAA